MAKDDAVGRRRWWGWLGLVGLWLVLVGFAGWAVLRGLGVDRFTPLAQLMAFTPYVAAVSLLPLVVALLMRRRPEAVVAGLVVAAFAAFVLPRVVPDPAPRDGVALRVMSVNLLASGADVGQVVELVRRERPDVVSVQELNADGVARLDAAGIAELLPHRALRPAPGVSGNGLYARHPLADAQGVDGRSGFDMVRAVLRTPGRTVDVVAVHTVPPIPGTAVRRWNADFGLLPAAPDSGRPLVLAGDFNATVDHSLFRRLLDTGYVDAASAVGKGLAPTWPEEGRMVPPVTLDHVLVDDRSGAWGFRTYRLRGSDHRAVVADLVLG